MQRLNRLQRVFHCSDRDLDFNHRGELSPRQRRRLQAYHILFWSVNVACSVLPFLSILALLLLNLQTRLGRGVFVFLILFIVGWGMVLLRVDFTGTARRNLCLDLEHNRVTMMQGTLHRIEHHQSEALWQVEVNGQPLKVSLSQYMTLEDHTALRVFLAPHFQLILAVEAV